MKPIYATTILTPAGLIILLVSSTSCEPPGAGQPFEPLTTGVVGENSFPSDSSGLADLYANHLGTKPSAALGMAAAGSGEGITLEEGDGFTVTLVERECASPTNTVSLLSPVETNLTSTACQEPIGRTWEFQGPFDVGAPVVFDFVSGVPNAIGDFVVSGSRPTWTVTFEDGFDSDYNDFIFEVKIIEFCEFFATPTLDAVLDDRKIQQSLVELADASGFGGPVQERKEQGGIFIDGPSGLEFVPARYLDPPGLCAVARDATQLTALMADPAVEVMGTIHTHPIRNAVVSNPGNCWQYRIGGNGSLQRVPFTDQFLQFGSGPSGEDLKPWVGGTPRFPGYAIDSAFVFRWSKTDFGQPIQIDSFSLSKGTNACIR